MSDRPAERKIEFIESYWTGGIYGADYVWNDNRGELVRCQDCKWYDSRDGICEHHAAINNPSPDWFCADGERKDAE